MAPAEKHPKAQGTDGPDPRTAARLAAVQALYQLEIGGQPPKEVIADFLAGRRPQLAADDPDSMNLPPPDKELFTAIVEGVIGARSGLDALIGEALAADWKLERLELLVRIILEAGAYELTARPDIPPKVSINEYVDVAHAFFGGAEPGLINGVLDTLAARAALTPASRDGA